MKRNSLATRLVAGIAMLIASSTGFAAVYEFEFTGRFTVVNPVNEIVADANNAGIFDPYGLQTPISASLTYDTTLGIGSAALFIAPFDFFGGLAPVTIHDMSLEFIGDNLILGNMLADWSYNNDMPVSVVWDATGLFNAFSKTPGGLQVGDVISGNQVLRNGDVINSDIQSALPATDGLSYGSYGPGCPDCPYVVHQGAAPLAMSTWNTASLCSGGDCLGLNPSGGLPLEDDGIAGSPMIAGPFPGMNINIDIGSGNSMTVTAVSSVPLPPAIYLFSIGLLGLAAGVRKKRSGR